MVLFSIAINVLSDILSAAAPGLARRIVRWLACRRFAGDAEYAKLRTVELVATVERWPGPSKLLVAAGLVVMLVAQAITNAGRHRAGPIVRCGHNIQETARREATTLWAVIATASVEGRVVIVRAVRSVTRRIKRVATVDVMTVRPVVFRVVMTALFAAAPFIGDLAGGAPMVWMTASH